MSPVGQQQLGPEEVAAERLVVSPHVGDVERLRRSAPGVADTDASSPVRQGGEALLQGRAAHRVDDHVGAPPVGQPTHLGHEVGGGVVDPLVEAELAEPTELLVARGGGEDPGPGPLGQLDGGDADAPGPGVDEHRLAGTQAASGVDRPSGILQANPAGTARRAAWDPSTPTVTTRSPGANPWTALPTSATVPAHW